MFFKPIEDTAPPVADLAKDPFSAMFFKPIEDTTPPVADLAKDP
jgi:hypothetical protein